MTTTIDFSDPLWLSENMAAFERTLEEFMKDNVPLIQHPNSCLSERNYKKIVDGVQRDYPEITALIKQITEREYVDKRDGCANDADDIALSIGRLLWIQLHNLDDSWHQADFQIATKKHENWVFRYTKKIYIYSRLGSSKVIPNTSRWPSPWSDWLKLLDNCRWQTTTLRDYLNGGEPPAYPIEQQKVIDRKIVGILNE